MDTLRSNQDHCVGMAANMIGVKKKIIIVNMGIMNVVMYNPVIVKKDTPYETEEGCLSLTGVRKTTRYQNIEVEYYDSSWKKHRQSYSGWTAQNIQHITAAILLLTACSSGGQVMDGEDMVRSYTQISQDEAKQMMEQDGTQIIVDVRTQEEYDSGHIPGAICIPNESIGTKQPVCLHCAGRR